MAALTALAACSGDGREAGPGSARSGNGATPATGAQTGAGVGESPVISRPDVPDAATSGAQCVQAIDIVFVMDVSSSMDAFLNKLASEIAVVDSALIAMSPTASPYYGLAVFVDDAKLLNGGKPYANVGSLKAEFQNWANKANQNRQLDDVESNTTWPENSLDALYDAAESFAWRPGSLRVVIHTTDDTFWDGPTTADGETIKRGYAQTVARLNQDQIRLFSFAATRGGPSETDDVSAGWFSPYKGAAPLPQATFGGVFELDKVLKGQLSLADSIKGAVQSVLCAPYPKVN